MIYLYICNTDGEINQNNKMMNLYHIEHVFAKPSFSPNRQKLLMCVCCKNDTSVHLTNFLKSFISLTPVDVFACLLLSSVGRHITRMFL